MLKPGALVESRDGKRMVILPPRCQADDDGKEWVEHADSYGWGTADREDLRVVGEVKPEVDGRCRPCLFHEPACAPGGKGACVRYTEKRWNYLSLNSSVRGKGKEIPFRSYPDCKKPIGREPIP